MRLMGDGIVCYCYRFGRTSLISSVRVFCRMLNVAPDEGCSAVNCLLYRVS